MASAVLIGMRQRLNNVSFAGLLPGRRRARGSDTARYFRPLDGARGGHVVRGKGICGSLTRREERQGRSTECWGIVADGPIVHGRLALVALVEQFDVAASDGYASHRTGDGHGVAIDIAHINRMPVFTNETGFDQAVPTAQGFAHGDTSRPSRRKCVAGSGSEYGWLGITICTWTALIPGQSNRQWRSVRVRE